MYNPRLQPNKTFFSVIKGVPMSSYGYQITLKTSETTNSRSQITIMATKTMSDEKPAFRKITGLSVFQSDLYF